MSSRDGGPREDDLGPLFQASVPAEPSEETWAAVLDAVRRGIDQPKVQTVRIVGRRRALRIVAAGLVAAAAVLLALTLPRPIDVPPDLPPETEPFPVAEADDVEILGVDAADARALVVGTPPARAPIVLVEPGDVTLRSLERDANGNFPSVNMQTAGDETPMIWPGLAKQ